jgi:hypothetical protein
VPYGGLNISETISVIEGNLLCCVRLVRYNTYGCSFGRVSDQSETLGRIERAYILINDILVKNCGRLTASSIRNGCDSLLLDHLIQALQVSDVSRLISKQPALERFYSAFKGEVFNNPLVSKDTRLHWKVNCAR